MGEEEQRHTQDYKLLNGQSGLLHYLKFYL